MTRQSGIDPVYMQTVKAKTIIMFVFMQYYLSSIIFAWMGLSLINSGHTIKGVAGLLVSFVLLLVGVVFNKKWIKAKQRVELIKDSWNKLEEDVEC